MKRIFVAGIVVLLLLLSFQYTVVLKGQTALPSDEWSRAYAIDLNPGNYNAIQSVESEEGYTISLTDLSHLTVVSCDTDKECVFDRKFEKVNTYRNTWSDKSNSYYIKSDQLINWKDGKESVIADPIKDFIVAGDLLVYWTEENEVYILNRDSLEVNSAFITDQEIYSIVNHGLQLFVVLKEPNGSTYSVNLYDGELFKLFDFPVRFSESLLDLKIVKKDKYYLFIQKQVTEGGGKTISYYTAPFDQAKPNQTISLQKLAFLEAGSGQKLLEVQNSNLYYKDGTPMLTFSAAIYDSFGNKNHKIFTGGFDRETIHATAVTKVGERYSRPTQIDDETIMFFRLDGKDRYLSYASSNKSKLVESSGIMDGDYKESFYQLITLMTKGILLLLLSFLWLLPGLGLVYLAKNIWGRYRSDNISYKLLVFFFVICLLVFQAVGFFKIMNYKLIVDMIPYIATTWQFIGLIVLSMVIAIIPIFLSKKKLTEDYFSSVLLFISVMNLATLFVLIGPYLI